MSLLSSFLAKNLIPALEQALISHAPEMQAAVLKEISELSKNVSLWIESKLDDPHK